LGYELLFRVGLKNYFQGVDGDEATTRVIADSFLLFGLEALTGNKKAFINFTYQTLVRDYALALPAGEVVVEVLEDVDPDDRILSACRRLKAAGYTLALDDFVFAEKFQPLLELADIVKVDFRLSGAEERAALAERCRPMGIKLLAEKVETHEEFEAARDMGYVYFQGYFFSRPVIVSRKDVPSFKLHLLRIMKEVNQEELDFDRLAEMFGQDVSLSYKLLKLINSAYFGLSNRVENIKQALGLLGENGVRKWTNILAMTKMAEEKPHELVVNSLIRAKFCEGLASLWGREDRASDLFLLGLFSHLEAIVGRPMNEVLSEVSLSDDIAASLTGDGPWAGALRLVGDFESGDWPRVRKRSRKLGLAEGPLAAVYLEAMQFPHRVLYSG
jgi:EAL and modified HD-GYP domain-containing signal transduction protein